MICISYKPTSPRGPYKPSHLSFSDRVTNFAADVLVSAFGVPCGGECAFSGFSAHLLLPPLLRPYAALTQKALLNYVLQTAVGLFLCSTHLASLCSFSPYRSYLYCFLPLLLPGNIRLRTVVPLAPSHHTNASGENQISTSNHKFTYFLSSD